MVSLSGLAGVNRLTLREQVLASLREAITTGQLGPGDHLGEAELAETYSVSRGTVREALRYLQQAGLVTGDARGKLRVRMPTAVEIGELFQVRGALEGLAVKTLIESGNRKQAAEELRGCLPPDDKADVAYLDRLRLDLAFHERLCELSDNAILLELWKQLEDRMKVVLISQPGGDLVDLMVASRHALIVDLIEKGDVEEVQRAVTEHMEHASQRWAASAG